MHRSRLLLLVAGALLLGAAAPTWAIQAGITFDVHQDILDQELWPNDFHVEGYICSNGGVWPQLLQHLDGQPPFVFQHFVHTIQPLGDCWYWFEATWWNDPGTGYIPYCTVMHLGLLFDVDGANVIIDLVGWWTRDGVPVGQIYGGLGNDGYVPLIGFNVLDTSSPQTMQIGNGDTVIAPPLPLPPNPPPWPPADLELWVMQAEVVPFPPGAPPPFEELFEFGHQQFWPWIPITFDDGQPISRMRPLYWMPDSFFDIFLENAPPPGAGKLGVLTPFTIEPGGFLVSRQLVGFFNNSTREYEERWFWEIHGAQFPEACCFPDGSCQDLNPFTCTQLGGQPMGPGSFCHPGLCAQVESGACCYGDVASLCVVTDPVTCQQQYNGVWMGPGTNCDDLNGNGVADICEPPPPPEEACCLPDGSCVMLLPPDCLQQGGIPKGPGSRCLGDFNGNGVDDICEAKWLQMPDLAETGIDVKSSVPLVLADDFLCTHKGLITDVVVWGSWFNDILPIDPMNVRFTLSFHADIPDPDGQGPLYSMPGEVLWVQSFVPGQFVASVFEANLQEGWWDPSIPNSYIFPGDTICWQYYFPIPPHLAFCQRGTPDEPIVYWLDVQAEPLGGPALAQFGWKTSLAHWNDDAVWGLGQEPYLGPWSELRYPAGHLWYGQSIDLAFALAGDLPCPPAICPGDLNCDGQVDFGDINPFVLYISNFAAWQVKFPGCDPRNGDINGDGIFPAFSDINPFVKLISSGQLPIPCPS